MYPYTWNAESQLKAAGGVTYSYDADGRRAAKVGSKLYWYGSGGEILAETDASGTTTAEYIFFGGRRVALLPAGANPQYYVEDFLGVRAWSRKTTERSATTPTSSPSAPSAPIPTVGGCPTLRFLKGGIPYPPTAWMFVWSPKSPGTKGPEVGSSTSTLHWYGSGGEILARPTPPASPRTNPPPFPPRGFAPSESR